MKKTILIYFLLIAMLSCKNVSEKKETKTSDSEKAIEFYDLLKELIPNESKKIGMDPGPPKGINTLSPS